MYTRTGDQRLRAHVVLYDYQRDVAVLYVPGLDVDRCDSPGRRRPATRRPWPATRRDQPFTAVPARIGGTQQATGPNIYETAEVTREIYSIRASVEPGNSGGPLLARDGSVYGVVFAAAVGQPDIGYALTAAEVAPDAQAGASDTAEVSTGMCD